MVKLIIKRILFLGGLIATFPLILITWIEEFILGDRSAWVFSSCKEILSLCPTFLGDFMRLAYYWAVCTKVSINACFLFGCMLARRNTTVRSGAIIGAYSIIGYADIGENVLLAPRVSLLSGKYQHGRPEQRVTNGEVVGELQRISIGKNSWVGQDAVIMANIGENCTVSAGSVVYKDVPDNTTVMGNPARKVSL